MTIKDATAELHIANAIIIKRHRYACGIEPNEYAEGLKDDRARFFFSSPDGQNGELFYELRNLGWRNSGYNAEYFWKVSKDGVFINYTEGDIYITLAK